MTDDNDYDVLVVGAGLSGIGAGVHLQERCPNKRFAILEGRERTGGTWDLFRYPGVRSDSDMFTLGYPFRPWQDTRTIAPGEAILDYIRQTAQEYELGRHVQLQRRVRRASWSSATARWTVEADAGERGELVRYTCNFLYLCSGYYRYEHGYLPEFPDADTFRGPLIHPQQWPTELAVSGKRVVVIGSGATAVTLVPALAAQGADVTMLQRSPTYVLALPSVDPLSGLLRRVLPAKTAAGINRLKNVWLTMLFFESSRRWPRLMRRLLRLQTRLLLGRRFDVDRHFSPSYAPWDQRVCIAADADLFRALRKGEASIVTEHIERFVPEGIRLQSGQTLAADVIVSATGLDLVPLGDIAFDIDGQALDPGRTLTYKGMMFSGVPNLAQATGYTNASWTLKCDLTNRYLCRLLNFMEQRGYRTCTPRPADPDVATLPFVDFSSGYVQRAIDRFPKQGSKAPWRLYQNYVRDLLSLRYARLEDDVLEFGPAPTAATPPLAATTRRGAGPAGRDAA
ncbi:MAG TPA: NAD(P)/FAD-dependent oxidoreductase [Gammaproteobacteria bacterium]|nr:NAD(P)/FAD-dependent oxidoreductase [Gammaproteobacteria bacterium]